MGWLELKIFCGFSVFAKYTYIYVTLLQLEFYVSFGDSQPSQN